MSRVAKTALLSAVAGAAVLGASGMAFATTGAGAFGAAENSPGVGSGNLVQAPVHVPVNACGNTVTVIGALNPVFGNDCVNH
ncbi:chaplin [Streptomyces purpurogeneiscleroticus]|uniref:chaplin n=1 Tax=Streptomyces purpurogeneiscleroticus TaxID=68259 RepID=UPI001CBFE618|nr:chaplin [Streptomyces purpurogeneiscleroticus]MBZ4015993.1 chaplin [Streptomyces purpurogeneiscleroticus]